ncbi:hypothetical protein WISP_53975 [Willisornis vidua]|uniref:Uncharacterized protein n=1 Tax=Willisornis vidua TaxID=1566151 RepID=A0ABQ9DCR9_9PASS|nr:hypothetical protein WISP_53975 [Willisornis vidua]
MDTVAKLVTYVGADVSLPQSIDYNGNIIKPQVYSYSERALTFLVLENLRTGRNKIALVKRLWQQEFIFREEFKSLNRINRRLFSIQRAEYPNE